MSKLLVQEVRQKYQMDVETRTRGIKGKVSSVRVEMKRDKMLQSHTQRAVPAPTDCSVASPPSRSAELASR